MVVNLDVVGASIDSTLRSWTRNDALLYAVGVGAGSVDPIRFEVEFTTENSIGVEQKVLPTFAAVFGHGLRKEFDLGELNTRPAVQSEQAICLFAPIPVEGTINIRASIAGIYDKGSGCLMDVESVGEFASGRLYTSRTGVFFPGMGGFGGPRSATEDEGSYSLRVPTPLRSPDHVVRYDTRMDQALIYRLSGDHNPLHSDAEFARRAGFDKPILHGLCTHGFVGRALLHGVCGSEPGRFGDFRVRFSKPVVPGDALVVSIWDNSDIAEGSFLFVVKTDLGETVISAGYFRYLVK